MNLLSQLMFAGLRDPLQTKGECANSTTWKTRPPSCCEAVVCLFSLHRECWSTMFWNPEARVTARLDHLQTLVNVLMDKWIGGWKDGLDEWVSMLLALCITQC